MYEKSIRNALHGGKKSQRFQWISHDEEIIKFPPTLCVYIYVCMCVCVCVCITFKCESAGAYSIPSLYGLQKCPSNITFVWTNYWWWQILENMDEGREVIKHIFTVRDPRFLEALPVGLKHVLKGKKKLIN